MHKLGLPTRTLGMNKVNLPWSANGDQVPDVRHSNVGHLRVPRQAGSMNRTKIYQCAMKLKGVKVNLHI